MATRVSTKRANSFDLLYRLALKGILLQLMYPCQIVIHELYDFSEWPLSIFQVLLHSLEICGDRF